MAFSDFDLKTAVKQFGLVEKDDVNLFPDVPALPPSAFLIPWLEQFAALAIGFNSERARSDFIVTPVLAEAKLRADTVVNVVPGVTLDIDKEQGLVGYCDYVMTRSPNIYYLQGPVFVAIEAKKEDITAGLGQCAAAMVAIRIFNERDETPLPAVFGCVSSGTNWRFLKLEGATLYIDAVEYYLSEVAKILGILVSIARG